MIFFFFFSSRRRHTRCLSDWSSDVCSSDLRCPGYTARHGQDASASRAGRAQSANRRAREREDRMSRFAPPDLEPVERGTHELLRSEERRVGKSGEGGCRRRIKKERREDTY